MGRYYIKSIRRVDMYLIPSEDEILSYLDEVGEAKIESLEDIVKGMDSFGPINIPFVLGFTEGFIKKSMLRSMLDIMSKKGLIMVNGDTVSITERGRIAYKGIREPRELKVLPAIYPSTDITLEPGHYMAELDRPVEKTGVLLLNCYLGLHRGCVSRGERYIDFILPVRTVIPIDCIIRTLDLEE